MLCPWQLIHKENALSARTVACALSAAKPKNPRTEIFKATSAVSEPAEISLSAHDCRSQHCTLHTGSLTGHWTVELQLDVASPSLPVHSIVTAALCLRNRSAINNVASSLNVDRDIVLNTILLIVIAFVLLVLFLIRFFFLIVVLCLFGDSVYGVFQMKVKESGDLQS